MGKKPKVWIRVRFGLSDDKGLFYSGSEYFKKTYVRIGSSSVNVCFE